MRSDPIRACVICKRPVPSLGDTKAASFCSPRCKLVDLARWFDGAYRFAGSMDEADAESFSSSEATFE